MRLVPVKYLKEGDIIARDIMSFEGGILLRSDTKFKEAFRGKLVERNIIEVYIEDEISEGIEPVDIIHTTAKIKMTSDIKEQFERLKSSLELDVEYLNEITHFLIEELSKGKMLLELEDLKTNDHYTYEHCIAVAILADLVCTKMNMDSVRREKIVMGALIHDIGKIILPKDILNKPGRLTKEEFELIRAHAEIGYHMIKDNHELSPITKLAVLCHHEREDGSGYPLGKGEDLHIGAKIVAACDLYHALISDRCYRQGLSIKEAIEIARREPINPEIRNIIEECFYYYPVGSIVKLNNGKLGIVEKNTVEDIRRPLVRVIDKEDGKLVAIYRVDLYKQREYCITERYNGEI